MRIADDDAARDAAAAAALIEAVRPVIEGCHRLGRVGWVGLWNEVADGFAYALADRADGVDVYAALATVGRLTGATPAPWRRRPLVAVVSTTAGSLCVLRKGGCCLAFTGSYDDDPAAHDDVDRAFAERFPDPPNAPAYCITCPRRSFPDCEARQVWWHEHGEPDADAPTGLDLPRDRV